MSRDYDFELEFDEYMVIAYDADTNTFVDEDWTIIWDIFRIVTPNDVYLLKQTQTTLIVPHRTLKGTGVELYYRPEDGGCDFCVHRNECLGYDEDDEY